jgi:hypothetical protein
MPRALWFLQWLGLSSAVRRALRKLRTVKGLLSTGCTVLGLGMCLSSWVLSSLLGDVAEGPIADLALSLEQVERRGSVVLLAICLLIAVQTTGKGAIVAFAPAEVVFLVAGPFSRRQLLSYTFLQLFLVFTILAFVPTILLSVFGSFFHLPTRWQRRSCSVRRCSWVFH